MSSSTHSWSHPITDDVCLRRIRSIRGVHVRNLTRFPRRDSVASALQQSVDASLSAKDGHSADDMDVLLARRRSRRISTASVATMRSIKSPSVADLGGLANGSAEGSSHSPEMPMRPRPKPNSVSPGPSHPPLSAPPTVRRQRSSSRASMISLSSRFSPHNNTAPFTAEPAPIIVSPRLDQTKLEAVVASRLLETFLTLSVPDEPPDPPSRSSPVSSPRSVKSPRSAFSLRPPSATSLDKRAAASPEPRHVKFPSASPSRAPISPPRSVSPSATRTQRHYSPSTASASASASVQPQPQRASPVPFYISPFHRPSTNPSFDDFDPDAEFGDWVTSSMKDVIVSVWGKASGSAERNCAEGEQDAGQKEWEVIVQWNVDLQKLKPLPPEYAAHLDDLPPNTLLFALSGDTELYCLPSVLALSSGPPSATGYLSDGELETATRPRKDFQFERHSALVTSMSQTRMKKSAGFPDLVSLVTLQACVVDTRESVNAIAKSSAAIFDDPTTSTSLRRQVSEREDRLRTIRKQVELVQGRCREVAADVQKRAKELQERREQLAEARKLHEADVAAEWELAVELNEARSSHLEIVRSIPPARACLVRVLDYIFPIEPLSAGDLLFTILEAPLPVPAGPSDPTPPLTLHGHPTVNEDAVASALGYAAQVVQLLAVYLDTFLPYPITYAGSRTLVKDPISEMHGPRMFPLYSKGVETYRFEYAVFLLNKDIELLMMRQNLRALDLRHTLPNLKNLLLTLTSTDGRTYTRRIREHDEESFIEPDRDKEPVDASPAASSTVNSTRSPFLSPLAAMLRTRYAGSNFLKPAANPIVSDMSATETVLAESVVPVESPVVEAKRLANGDDATKDAVSADAPPLPHVMDSAEVG